MATKRYPPQPSARPPTRIIRPTTVFDPIDPPRKNHTIHSAVAPKGFPYDDGYAGRYAEADTHKALEELRMGGVACLRLSIGATASTDALERVFGSAGSASAATLADLRPLGG
jgi:hypothetical protein